MKRKTDFQRGESLLRLHILAFTIFTIALWWSVLSTFNYPGNAESPFTIYSDFIMSRIGATMFWGVVVLLHFAVHQFSTWSQSRQRQFHLQSVSKIQERCIPESRLDLESQMEDGVMMDEDEWQGQNRLQSK